MAIFLKRFIVLMYQLLSLLCVLVACLFLYQKIATLLDDIRYPPPGRLVDIGGYRLHLNCSGEGGPSVILDAGLSGTSLGWTCVQKEVSAFTRVCSFDRAGYSWSDESPLKRTSVNVARELHTLLQKANISAPYLLVGHSFGGCNALLFAHLYPEETLGVILVDSVHEDMLSEFPNESLSLLNHPWCRWLQAALGMIRLRGPSPEIVSMFSPLPEAVRKSYLAQMNKTRYTKTVSEEIKALAESLSQLRDSNVHLENIPITVITAAVDLGTSQGQNWDRLQKRLLLKSSRSKQIVADKSDHMIHHHEPDIITQAIRDMIATTSEAQGFRREGYRRSALHPL